MRVQVGRTISKCPKAGVAIAMMTSDRSHSAAIASSPYWCRPRLRSLRRSHGSPFAAIVAAPGLDALPDGDGRDYQSGNRVGPAPTEQSVQQ